MKRTFAILLCLLLGSTAFAQQDEDNSSNYMEMKVKGTEMERLPFVIDVLKQMPELLVRDNEITVIGRGTPAIYIDNRKVTELSELSDVAASYVSSITLMIHPGAEYGKDVQAVIVIHLNRLLPDGMSGDATVRFDMKRKLATNAKVSVGWKRKSLTLGTFLDFNEERKVMGKEVHKTHYEDRANPVSELSFETPDIHKQQLNGRLFGSYDLAPNHNLTASYALMYIKMDRTIIPENKQTNYVPDTRHDVALEYMGKVGAWSLTVSNNSFFDHIRQEEHKPLETTYYLRREEDVRTFAKASAPLWKGTAVVGAEHEYNNMDVDKHSESIAGITPQDAILGVHALHPDHTIGLFASTQQSFGNWSVEGGLRYEHRYSAYKPCEDDGLMKALNNLHERGILRPELYERYYIAGRLLEDGKISLYRDFFYPTLKVKLKQGESLFTLAHTESSVRPYLGLTRLSVSDASHIEDRILTTERVLSTSLDWQYRWIGLTASYNRFQDPICGTMDGTISYNAPDYDAMDINAKLAPKIGFWSPVLNVIMHKQWFYMELANGKDKLYEMLWNVSFNNTLAFSHNWLLLFDANWRSKGAERNWYFYRPDFCLNASIQKELPRIGLTFILSANNILRGSYNDQTRYTQAYKNLSEGMRERVPRNVSLTVRWKI